MGTERGERRHRGTEEARDDVRLQAREDVRSQAREDVRRQRVKERRWSGGGGNDGEGEVKRKVFSFMKGRHFPLGENVSES